MGGGHVCIKINYSDLSIYISRDICRVFIFFCLDEIAHLPFEWETGVIFVSNYHFQWTILHTNKRQTQIIPTYTTHICISSNEV